MVESRGPEPIHFVFEDIHWTAEVGQQEAQRHLEVTFYPFKKVRYHQPRRSPSAPFQEGV